MHNNNFINTNTLIKTAFALVCRSQDHLPRMSFVEVADTRVSRVHCIIRLSGHQVPGRQQPVITLEDCSSNGE